MSVYFVKGKEKGWRYDFTLKGIRHTEAWFKTKTKAKQVEAKKKGGIKKSKKTASSSSDNSNRHGLLGTG